MNALLRFLRRQRRTILAVLGCILVAGIVAAVRLPTAILPEVTFPRVTVIAEAGEQPPEEVVRSITRPLEESFRRVVEIREIRSKTSRGSTEIQIDCDWHARMDHVLQLIQAQIDATRGQLPAGTSVEARLMSPTLFPVLGFSLTSRTRSLAELRDIAVVELQPELVRLPGVAEVVVQGGHRPEARITLDPRALEGRRLDPATIADALRNAENLESVGLLDANRELYLTLADARPRSIDAIRAFPIPVDSGPPVPLGTLGSVSLTPAIEFKRYVAGPGEAVLVNVLRKPSASTITLSDGVKRWFREHPRALPPDVHYETFYDQSDLVRAAATSVRDSLLIGALIAILAVLLFLRSARLAFAGAIILPGSIAFTLVGLSFAHQTLNLMTLGGIAAAVGLVLDDAIVVVEHVSHRVARGAGGEAVRAAVSEIAPTLIGSSLCSLAIFIPFAFIGGVTGAFFRVLALSMALMLSGSLILCLVVVPWVAVAGRGGEEKPSRIRERFERLLERTFDWRWLAIGAVLLLLVAIVPLRATLGSGFLPEMDEGSLILDYVAPSGLSLNETDRMLRVIEKEIARVPEIESWSRRTGDELGFFVTEPNTGDYVLRLRSHRSRSADEIADALRERIQTVQPALEIEFGALIEDVVGDLTTSPEPVEVRILGEDRALDERRAEQAERILSQVRGVVDVKSGVVVSGSSLAIVPGIGARRAGLGAAELAERLQPYVEGIEAGQLPRGPRAWPVRLVYPRAPIGLTRVNELVDARVPLPSRQWARLGDLAELRVEPGETEISRDNQRTMVAATARLSGRDLGSAMKEIQHRIRRQLPLAPGMSVRYGGLYAEQQSSFRSLALVLLGAALAVSIVLVASFGSWPRTGAVLMVAGASLAGVLAALHVGRATFNIASFVGAIMVVGIVAENAYFLVAEYQDGRRKGDSPREAARTAARRRARPVVMTSVAGIAALAPLAIGLGEGSDLLRPLAIAVIGGFVTSAPLLLLVLPSLLAQTGRAAASPSETG